ncbi:MAG: DUF1343 domain-containing protein [Chitinophagaceae bacterium]
MKFIFIPLIAFSLIFCATTPQPTQKTVIEGFKAIRTGAEQTAKYLPWLQGKRVAIMANPTSIIGPTHLVDSLKKLGVNIVKVFGPEHGFRGNASAGAKVADETDAATGIPIISLYGAKNRPSKEDMANVDLLIYDLQDVGCRFYTNINALVRLMESCYENGKEMLILDRPNPNGYLIDGPILDMKYKSGIGMFPLPISHGLTVGEFALMANGEGWLANKVKCSLRVIEVENYKHDMAYTLPVKPSPNLNTQQSIMLYPSTCMFEGTYLNHGRGTYFPFTVIGSPELKGSYDFSFTPTGIRGMAETPLFMDEVCYGLDLRNYDIDQLRKSGKINLKWIMELYKAHPHKEKFFNSKLSKQMGTIEKLVGNGLFRQQLIDGKSEKEIRDSWETGLSSYKKMRKQYLLYKD